MGINFFTRNLRDAKFLLFEHLAIDKLYSYESFQDLNTKTISMMLEEANKFARDVLGPTMQDGDQEGCHYQDGSVTFPASYSRAWKLYGETGWIALSHDPKYGGQGLPMVVSAIIGELFQGANCTIAIGAELTAGAAELIERFGSEQEKSMFVEKMYSGRWSGTMALTEPEAGSDVGMIATRAIPEPESECSGIYRIEGSKQYITWGEHDLSENIIHLVLARIDGAPPGTKGLSLFIVPRLWVHPDGSTGTSNDIVCTSIEQKMGQHGSATCSLVFGSRNRCRGILLGSTTEGIAKMFQMMNELRLHSGLQGMALAASAYDAARQYAKIRIQGAPFTDPGRGAVPIVQHEDVRRMLMNLKAGTEALRALVAMVFYLSDQARHDPGEEDRKKAQRHLDFYIPIVKNAGADFSYELIRDAIQLLGGAGYCKDFPVEQYSRDCKINSIVEGTSYIQAKDLVTRKLGLGKGKKDRVFSEWFRDIIDFANLYSSDSVFGEDCRLLAETAVAARECVEKLSAFYESGQSEMVVLNATRLLDCLAYVTMGKLITEQGLIARDKGKKAKSGSADYIFYSGKEKTAHYFCRNFLPRVSALHRTIQFADKSALRIPEQAL